MAYKGTTGGRMGFTSIKPEHLRKKKKEPASYGAHLCGPIKVIKADGTVEIQEPLTAAQINYRVNKNKNNFVPNTVTVNPSHPKMHATKKQKALMDRLGIKYSTNIKKNEASKIISDFLNKK